MGTLTCPVNVSCSVDVTTAADGTETVSSVDGYVFSGSRAAKAAVVEMDADAQAAANDYLAFGVWLQEDGDAGTDGNQPAFAAFAGGGPEFETPATLTGSAEYNGAATGVYTAGSSVDYFQASATLTADFGTAPATGDDDELGTITGRIFGIVAGGENMSDIIRLNGGTITADGAFAGNARMGTYDPDTEEFPYNGHWGGQFYGPEAADDAEGADTLPPAAAGTFGVTGTTGTGDDAVTRSYVGAFGAHKDEDD